MEVKIIWTLQAVKGLDRVIGYLEKEWTEREILNLEENINEFLKRISKFPDLYPVAGKRKNIRKGLVDKNNYIIYKVQPRKGVIELINFRGTKQKDI